MQTILKRKVSESMKKEVAARQKWCCMDCDELLKHTFEVDHVVPLHNFGTNDINNLVAFCPNCHRLKTIRNYREAAARKASAETYLEVVSKPRRSTSRFAPANTRGVEPVPDREVSASVVRTLEGFRRVTSPYF